MKRQKCKKNKTIQNKRLEYGGKEQLESLELRDRVLRKPLGLKFSEQELHEEEQYHLAYVLDGQIKGILLLKPVSGTVIKMRQVAVDPDLQGTGIGRKLVRFSEEFAALHGFRRIELHARKTALEFYIALDYLAEGEEFLEVNIPHIKMYKVLN